MRNWPTYSTGHMCSPCSCHATHSTPLHLAHPLSAHHWSSCRAYPFSHLNCSLSSSLAQCSRGELCWLLSLRLLHSFCLPPLLTRCTETACFVCQTRACVFVHWYPALACHKQRTVYRCAVCPLEARVKGAKMNRSWWKWPGKIPLPQHFCLSLPAKEYRANICW